MRISGWRQLKSRAFLVRFLAAQSSRETNVKEATSTFYSCEKFHEARTSAPMFLYDSH